jgi:hypothetical protein
MDNVIKLVPDEIGDEFRHDVQEVIDGVPDNLKTIVILGETDDGDRWYASNANLGQMFWLMELIKHGIMSDD